MSSNENTSNDCLQADVSLRGGTGDESLPRVSALADDLLGIPVEQSVLNFDPILVND